MILVTGGAGFIGANFVHEWVAQLGEPVINLDKITYAGNPASLADLTGNNRHLLVRGDIGERGQVDELLATHRPRAIVHFAAESHVDRSIHGAETFIQTNVVGTFHLLEAARAYWASLGADARSNFRFVQVSTDEVYGSLGPSDRAFTEATPFAPNSPYSASKASADHLVRAYHHTYGLPVLTTNCSNNYGPYQFPEKLIPLAIHNALSGKPIPIYGDGKNVRDWLYVTDHCAAIRRVLEAGTPGEVYNVGGWNEKTNLEIVGAITGLLDRMRPLPGRSYADFVTFVTDRPGHDRRYAVDASKIRDRLGWAPEETFETGIEKTVRWYLDNPDWVAAIVNGSYRNWIDKQYGPAA